MNSMPSQSTLILARLTDVTPSDVGGWVPMPILSAVSGAYAVHSRVAELRSRGHTITNRIEHTKDGVRKSWYRLEVA